MIPPARDLDTKVSEKLYLPFIIAFFQHIEIQTEDVMSIGT